MNKKKGIRSRHTPAQYSDDIDVVIEITDCDDAIKRSSSFLKTLGKAVFLYTRVVNEVFSESGSQKYYVAHGELKESMRAMADYREAQSALDLIEEQRASAEKAKDELISEIKEFYNSLNDDEKKALGKELSDLKEMWSDSEG